MAKTKSDADLVNKAADICARHFSAGVLGRTTLSASGANGALWDYMIAENLIRYSEKDPAGVWQFTPKGYVLGKHHKKAPTPTAEECDEDLEDIEFPIPPEDDDFWSGSEAPSVAARSTSRNKASVRYDDGPGAEPVKAAPTCTFYAENPIHGKF